MILKQKSLRNKLGDTIVTVTNNVLHTFLKIFAVVKFLPCFTIIGDTGKLKENFRMTKVTFLHDFCRWASIFPIHLRGRALLVARPNQSGFTPIFRCMNFWRYFGAVSVAPHNGGHALVYVRVASPLAQAASTQSQWRVCLEIASRWWRTRDNARTAPRMSTRHNRTSMFVNHTVHTSNAWSLVTKNPLSRHSLYTFLWPN